MENKESILIFNVKKARHLIRNGFTVIDIKPHRENKDKTIFVFKRTESLLKELNNN